MSEQNNLYSQSSVFTQSGPYRPLLSTLPDDIASICQFTQNLLIHAYWLDKYGCSESEFSKWEEMQVRYAADILALASSKSTTSLKERREPKERVVSICRDFSLIVCTVLRAKGFAARIRCGFATYLTPENFEDHWICEYWNSDESRWVMVDAQLDELHCDVLNIDFDPYDVPDSKFLYAGTGWLLCRAGKEEPTKFGIHGFNDLPFIKGNLIRDLFALSRIEMLAWDTGWGILNEYLAPITGEGEFELLDQLACYSKDSDVDNAEKVVKSNQYIALPDNWKWNQSPTLSELFSHFNESVVGA
ncbi:MAG: transglutaminase domain-containing protein [Endozoicomonas sp.]|uniref:transglutaminase domain-containing protein n=1 Tax=Endozoicomonas sp. TaxID=1892382 RepID=UPI003D9B20DC